jgi:tellurite resistance protein TehA-like permease
MIEGGLSGTVPVRHFLDGPYDRGTVVLEMTSATRRAFVLALGVNAIIGLLLLETPYRRHYGLNFAVALFGEVLGVGLFLSLIILSRRRPQIPFEMAHHRATVWTVSAGGSIVGVAGSELVSTRSIDSLVLGVLVGFAVAIYVFRLRQPSS